MVCLFKDVADVELYDIDGGIVLKGSDGNTYNTSSTTPSASIQQKPSQSAYQTAQYFLNKADTTSGNPIISYSNAGIGALFAVKGAVLQATGN